MNIAVIGATGGTGRDTVRLALEQGHRVTAFARYPERLDIAHDKLTTIAGSADNPTDLRKAVAGSDAVICTLGAPARDDQKIRTRGTRHLVEIMTQHGPQRLIVLSSLGFADSKPLLGLIERLFVVPLYLANAFADHESQEAAVTDSSLDWTIVRPGRLLEGPPTGSYQEGFRFDDRSFKVKPMTKGDVAHFLVRQLEDGSYVKKTVGICGA